MIASWVVMVKLIVVVLSLMMYALTEYHKRRQAWDVVEIKVKDLDRMKRASRKGIALPDLTPRRLRSDSWSSQIVVVHGGGSVPGTKLIPSPLLRDIKYRRSLSTTNSDAFRLTTSASLESGQQGQLGSLSKFQEATESTRLLTRRNSASSSVSSYTPTYDRQNTSKSSYVLLPYERVSEHTYRRSNTQVRKTKLKHVFLFDETTNLQ